MIDYSILLGKGPLQPEINRANAVIQVGIGAHACSDSLPYDAILASQVAGMGCDGKT